MAYTLYNKGQFATRDGLVATNADFNPDVVGGALKMAGTAEIVQTVHPSAGSNIRETIVQNEYLAGAQYGTAVSVSGVGVANPTSGNGANKFTKLTRSAHGLTVGTFLWLTDASGHIDGPATVYSVESSSGFTVNKPYSNTIGAVTYAPLVGNLANLEAGNYSMKKLVSNVHGQQNTKLASGAADYGRSKIHAVVAVRTRKVATAIRAGYWNVFTGAFTTDPTVTNDFASMDIDGSNVPDDEAKNIIAGYGVGGELSYRNGTRSVITTEYDRKTT